MQNYIRYIIGGIVIILVGYLTWYFSSLVLCIFLSAILALMLRPLFNFINTKLLYKLKFSRSLSSVICLASAWLLVFAYFSFIIPYVVNEIQFLSSVDFTKVVDQLDSFIRDLMMPFSDTVIKDKSIIKTAINDSLKNLFDFSIISSFISSIFDFIGTTFIFMFSVSFITFFFLKEEDLLLNTFKPAVPKNSCRKLERTNKAIKRLLTRYFLGVIIQVSCISILISIGALIVGMQFNHALIIGVFAGIANIIPYLGPLIGAVFGFLVSFIVYYQQGINIELGWFMLGVGITFAVVQLLDNMIFQPIIFSSSIKAHPLEIFIVLFIAAYSVGVTGMFFAIPVYTILRVIAKEFFSKYQMVRHLTGASKE